MVVKVIFAKGRTDKKGSLKFEVPNELADINNNDWKVKAHKIIVRRNDSFIDTRHKNRVLSVSVNFCSPLQHQNSTEQNPGKKVSYRRYFLKRDPVKLAIAIVKNSLETGNYLELTSQGEEYVSFKNPPANLELLLRDEVTEEPLPDVFMIAHLYITRET